MNVPAITWTCGTSVIVAAFFYVGSKGIVASLDRMAASFRYQADALVALAKSNIEAAASNRDVRRDFQRGIEELQLTRDLLSDIAANHTAPFVSPEPDAPQ